MRKPENWRKQIFKLLATLLDHVRVYDIYGDVSLRPGIHPLSQLAPFAAFLLVDNSDRFSFRPLNRPEISIASDRVKIITLASTNTT